jgi:hypothetical protein
MNPDKCQWNHPKWSYKHVSPYEVSLMHNNNPCTSCINMIKHKCNPVMDKTPMRTHKLKGRLIKRIDTKRAKHLEVKGELLNARRQVGLTSGFKTSKDGSIKLDEFGFPIPALVKVVYTRLTDMPTKVSR